MKKRTRAKLVQEGRHVAEINVILLKGDTGWSRYLSAGDDCKVDGVRDALLPEDIKAASALARVDELRPVASQ